MRRLRTLTCAVLVSLAGGTHAAAPAPVVPDPAFGETLYAFYQRQYFDAISRLLVARERGELRRQAAEGELLLGGLYVQYGIPGAAQDIFASLLPADDGAPQVRRIWLALAELDYRRERFPEALAIVERHFPRPASLDALPAAERARLAPPEQAVMLAVKSLMRLGRYEEAIGWLGADISDRPESRYLRFNIAAALIGNGDAEGGAKILQALLAVPAADEEMRAVRDRVALALAATRLQQERPQEAFAAISLARLDGPYSNEAMLVYGISALRSGNAPGAVRALLPLTQRSSHEQAVQEGWVALAQAYEAGRDERRALAAYRAALKKLDAELGYLQEQGRKIDAGDWFRALEGRAQEIVLRDDRLGLRDADVLGMSLHYRMFAGNRFVLSFTQYVEVSRLARLAVDWQARIPVLGYLVQSRVERHRRLSATAQELLAATPVAPLAARQQELATRVSTAIADRDRPLPSAKQQRLLAQADTARTKMDAWPQHDWGERRAKLDLLRGQLAWELARDRPLREWNLRRAVRDNERLVTETTALRTRVRKAAATQIASVEGWRDRLESEDMQLQALARQSEGLRRALQARLEQDARDTIAARRQRIIELAGDAWFGIAQIEHGAWRDKRDAERARAAETALEKAEREAVEAGAVGDAAPESGTGQ
ncbi:MAG: hypothetical protein ACOY33_11720 [Pseudomonadota bacterium]